MEYHEYGVDSSCVQTVKHGFILGVDEIDGLGKENVSCIEVSEHLVHRLFEDQRLEGACLIIETKCSVCDRTVATEERKNNTITRTTYSYYSNGNLCDISIEESYVFYCNISCCRRRARGHSQRVDRKFGKLTCPGGL